jgi:superfamily II DNA/RNA helicase
MLDLDFEKKINFIIFKIHSARKKQISEPEIPKFKLDENGEPVEIESASASNSFRNNRIDPQTILISATLTSGIKEIARRLNVNDAIIIDASSSKIENINNKNLLALNSSQNNKNDEKVNDDNVVEKIALPSQLSHFYMSVPSKLRLIALISFILNKFVYDSRVSLVRKMIVFVSTNDSVQFHENVLSTFLNRKFNMYTDDDDYDSEKIDLNEYMKEYDSDLESQIRSITKNNYNKKQPRLNVSTGASTLESIRHKKNIVCEIFSLYGNMDQHKRAEILNKFVKANSGVLISTVSQISFYNNFFHFKKLFNW